MKIFESHELNFCLGRWSLFPETAEERLLLDNLCAAFRGRSIVFEDIAAAGEGEEGDP